MMNEIEKQIAENKARVEEILDEANFIDDDGYPTEQALEAIEKWHWDNILGWFQFIEELWAYHDFGWKENNVPHEWDKGKFVHRYYLSTAGWSGNESIIRAMQKNEMMWHLNWVQSRRGGHYIFELKELKDE